MLTIDDLLNELKNYNSEENERIIKAYNYAKSLHEGQYRQSGEPYIIHPLHVAFILAQMHADTDTICAGLLHDTLEDTETTKDEIAKEFNEEVAKLVDGVTKISKMNYSSKKEQNLANTRKIITGITEDVRIIIIKLADRLHNMRTLEFKSEFKQKENSIETMEIFVPLAYLIGAYRIKNELEDISFSYLKPESYQMIKEKKEKVEHETNPILEEMLETIHIILNTNGIPNEIKLRTKNIYGIYKNIHSGRKMSDIHDLLALKIMVEEIEDCYRSLYYIHGKYPPVNGRFKDYICTPKTNMYSSLHTTVFAPGERLVQTQIRTFKLDKIDSFGLTAYWDTSKEARYIMQKDLREKYQFFQSLLEINEVFGNNQEFLKTVKSEIFSEKVYVYTTGGDIIELPKGSTPIDFAYKLNDDIANTMIAAIVNDENVPLDYILQNKDRVRIITDELSFGPREEWIGKAKTSYAKRRIKEFKSII